MEKERERPGVLGHGAGTNESYMVGATGFEPATTSTPRRCATGLRYAPTSGVDGVRDGGILHESALLGQGDSERPPPRRDDSAPYFLARARDPFTSRCGRARSASR